MADKIIVSLVSEQTIPNVQFLKWYIKNNLEKTDLLFISTKRMEENSKSDYIKEALTPLLKFTEFIETKIVDENDLQIIQKVLYEAFKNSKYKKIIANITGGTKLMSLASFQFFSSLKNSEIYYQPLNKPVLQLFPVTAEYEVSGLLTLEEYMKANGIKYNFDNTCVRNWDFNKTVCSKIIEPNKAIVAAMCELQNTAYFKNVYKRKEYVDFIATGEEKFSLIKNPSISKSDICALIDSSGFTSHKVALADLRYFTGGWFEEFVYQKVLNEMNIKSENVALNVHIEKGNDKNELDVVYLDSKNQLHVIECKSFLDGKDGPKVLNDALYKLQAITKSKFGLTVKPHLYTMSTIEKESALNRAGEFGIELVDGTYLS